MAYLGAGPTAQLLVLKDTELCLIRVHTKFGYSVAPDAEDLLLKCRGDVHQSRIMCKHGPRLLKERSGLV